MGVVVVVGQGMYLASNSAEKDGCGGGGGAGDVPG